MHKYLQISEISMRFHKFPKISINIFGGIFLFLFFFVSLLTFNFVILTNSTFAQDAIQCTPGDVNLNRNLRFVDNDNIYLGTGYLNFSSGNNGIYAANDSSNLLFRNDSAQIINRSNTIEFQNTAGNRLTGIYNSNPSQPAVNGNHYFIVDGAIEGYAVNGLNELCVQGSCINSWPTSCTGTQKLTASGSTFSCSDDVDTDTRCSTSGECNQLCIGTDCVDSWAKVMSAGGGSNINMTTNLLTIGSGATLLIDSGAILKNAGIYQVCDAGGVNCVGTGRGVSKIIDGDGAGGISISPASGDGDVTISIAGSAPCAAGFTRVGNACLKSFGTEPLIRQVLLCNSGDPSINGWGTLDVPDLNATNAVFAIVRSYCGENKMYIRETGSGIVTLDATNELCYAGNDSTDWNRYTTGSRYIKLDGNKDFDWYNIGTDCGNNTLDARIYLSGYIEN